MIQSYPLKRMPVAYLIWLLPNRRQQDFAIAIYRQWRRWRYAVSLRRSNSFRVTRAAYRMVCGYMCGQHQLIQQAGFTDLEQALATVVELRVRATAAEEKLARLLNSNGQLLAALDAQDKRGAEDIRTGSNFGGN